MRILFHTLTVALIGLIAAFTLSNTDLLSSKSSLPFIWWDYAVNLYILEWLFVLILLQWIVFTLNTVVFSKKLKKANAWRDELKSQLFDEQDKLIEKITKDFKETEEKNISLINEKLLTIDESLGKLYSEVWFLSNKDTSESEK